MEDNLKPIYTIMVFEKCEKDNLGFRDLGCTRIVGFKYKLEEAINTVVDNVCDICESCYRYALIEEVEPCVYPCSDKRWYFIFNKRTEKYEEIEEPEIFKKSYGITMG